MCLFVEINNKVWPMSIRSMAVRLQLDASLKVVSCDESFEESFGYLERSVAGKSLWLLLSDRYGSGMMFVEKVRASLQRIGSWRGEIWVQRADGQENIMLVDIQACSGNDVASYQAVCLSFVNRSI